MLWFALDRQSHNTNRYQLVTDFSTTLGELRGLSGYSRNGSTIAIESAPALVSLMAQSIAVGDVQSKSLRNGPSVFSAEGFGSSANGIKLAAATLDADWLTLREKLSNLPQSVVAPTSVSPTTAPVKAQPQIQLPSRLVSIGAEFENIQSRVTEGSQSSSLRQLVSEISNNWQRLQAITVSEEIQQLVQLQKRLANDLIRQSGVGSDQPLFGYATSNLIFDYVNDINRYQFQPTISQEVSQVDNQNQSSDTVVNPVNTANNSTKAANAGSVVQAFAQIDQSLAGYRRALDDAARRNHKLVLLAIIALSTALLMTVLAAWRLSRKTCLLYTSPSPRDRG